MTTHDYWGRVEADEAGFSAEWPVALPTFTRPVKVYVGDELDEDGEEVEAPPAPAELAAYAATLQRFLADAERLLAEFQRQAFARYQELYAHYYDDPAQSGEPALHLTAAQHVAYVQDVWLLRVSAGEVVRLAISYDLDPEHGLEARFVGNELDELAGLAET